MLEVKKFEASSTQLLQDVLEAPTTSKTTSRIPVSSIAVLLLCTFMEKEAEENKNRLKTQKNHLRRFSVTFFTTGSRPFLNSPENKAKITELQGSEVTKWIMNNVLTCS